MTSLNTRVYLDWSEYEGTIMTGPNMRVLLNNRSEDEGTLITGLNTKILRIE
jgi:hypothetical protein